MADHIPPQSNDPIDILLVEDNPGDVRLTEEAFEASDHETVLHPVRNGDEAVERLYEQATDEPDALPDIALVDLNLPGRDGCGVLEAIRDHSQLKSLPVIILTSSSASEDVERCYEANANAYLTKPTGPGDFESLVAGMERFWVEQAVLPPMPT